MSTRLILPPLKRMTSSTATRPCKTVAVLGGGIAGLASAFRLAQEGHAVTLIESSPQLGGLGTFFQHDGRTFEKFYHCMLPTDGPLLKLIDDIGLTSEIYWKPTSFGYWHNGETLPLNTAVDLLKFKPLNFIDRLRVGFTGLWGRKCQSTGLDDITAVDWLTKLSGANAFQTFWLPLLQAKFGDRYHDVPALWFWTRFNREKGDSKGECKGYLRGGYKRIIDTLAAKLRTKGVLIQTDTAIESIDLNEAGRAMIVVGGKQQTFDELVVTLPWPAVQHLAGERLRAAAGRPLPEIDYQGVTNLVLFLERPLTPHYWVATPQPEFPFDGVIETSTLTNDSDRGTGRHVVYLTKYMHRTDPRFREDETQLTKSWWASLKTLFPGLSDEHLESSFVFRAPFVEPLYTRGYLNQRPPEVLVPGKVFLCSAAQVYPNVTSWNGSVAQCDKTLAARAGAVTK